MSVVIIGMLFKSAQIYANFSPKFARDVLPLRALWVATSPMIVYPLVFRGCLATARKVGHNAVGLVALGPRAGDDHAGVCETPAAILRVKLQLLVDLARI